MRLLFVQSFEMQGQAGGGSSKIFRSLISHAPANVGVAIYGARPPKSPQTENEWFIRERWDCGRLERSRLARYIRMLTRALLWKSSGTKLWNSMSTWRPDHVHLHIHGLGFVHAARWCRANNVPFSLSVHDDIRHQSPGLCWMAFVEDHVAKAWRDAVNRFVISDEMGAEYSARYGQKPWVQITDGLEEEAIAHGCREPNRQKLTVYFAGAVNVPYEPNLRALQQGLKLYQEQNPTHAVRLVLRGGRNFDWEDSSAPGIEVRPFGTPQEVETDLKEADVLYLPLSIDPCYSNFARFSLSTKMVTYLGSGLPILYHGPADAAAGKLLSHANASACCASNDPPDLLQAIYECIQCREQITLNALRLARERFLLTPLKEAFWTAVYRE
jgi:hypothetical protein